MDLVKFPSRLKSKTRLICCVENCKSSYSKNLDLRFYKFPNAGKRFVYVSNIFEKLEKIDHFEAWKKALKIREVKKSMKVCSLHFKKSDFILFDIAGKRKHLKKNAVPSINLPEKKNKTADKSRENRLLLRNKKKGEKKNVISESKDPVPHTSMKVNKKTEIENANLEDKDHLDKVSSNNSNTNTVLEKQIQMTDIEMKVSRDVLKIKFVNLINSDAKLSTATGLESFHLLNTIVDILNDKFGHKFKHKNNKIDIFEKVIMVYVKLKQNLSYAFLSVLFDCYSPKHCQRIFYAVIKMLSESLKPAIKWPSRKVISKNIPICFKDFKDVRVVLDCTEIFTQCPQNLCCQLITYSTYKKSRTCKFLTGVTPAGNISYISKAYGGRASDKAIFEQSDLISLLEPKDAIMVDKGFTIDDICSANQWKLYRPSFLRDKSQFSKGESLLTAKIARARVHVERSNQRIKTFQILGETMSANLIPLVEDIFTVICATVNLSAPILKDDKFILQTNGNK